MPSISFPINAPHFHNFVSSKCPRTAASLPRTIGYGFLKLKKEKEVSVQLSSLTSPVSRVETFCNLHFGRWQPSPQELGPHNSFEFGNFVVRESLLEEEYWTAAWLRAEYEGEKRKEQFSYYRKREFAYKEFYKIKKRCKEPQQGQSSTCIITVKKQHKDVKRLVVRSVVGTLDLNIRYLLVGETFPGELGNPPRFCKVNRTPSSIFGYIANLCVAKSLRRKGIASNMLYFAVESAKSNGVPRLYVHVDRDNNPALVLYQKFGFEVVDRANPSLIKSKTYLLGLDCF
ncbi:unnamed protein product [Sphenostylis stenocarpa]|uniref:N-acetyltransferase domain-containing protein n=1 Tax=Sphenostylis stenocarpa TaxID=92480 RepID=A0AA86S9W9_9FABA|nr:unnamed protein product [Sphenostylis stenocarpa]